MKLFLDANVVLDVLAAREPWVRDAAHIMTAIDAGDARGCVAAHTATTLHYLIARERGRASARNAVLRMTDLLEILAVDERTILQALSLGLDDFGDAVQAACALRAEVDRFVTRDAADFDGAELPLATPAETAALFGD